MKVGDYVICKSIPKDSFEGSFTIGKIYKIESVNNKHVGSHSTDDNNGKVYFVFGNDYYPYIILDSKLSDNFESLRDRNLDLLI